MRPHAAAASTIGTGVLSRPLKVIEWHAVTNLVELCHLTHPNILTIFGVSDVDGKLVLVEDFCVMGELGVFLDSLMAQHKEFDVLAKLACGVVAGCRYLHESSPPVVAQLSGNRILVDGNFTAKIRVELQMKTEQGDLVPNSTQDVWCANRH